MADLISVPQESRVLFGSDFNHSDILNSWESGLACTQACTDYKFR